MSDMRVSPQLEGRTVSGATPPSRKGRRRESGINFPNKRPVQIIPVLQTVIGILKQPQEAHSQSVPLTEDVEDKLMVLFKKLKVEDDSAVVPANDLRSVKQCLQINSSHILIHGVLHNAIVLLGHFCQLIYGQRQIDAERVGYATCVTEDLNSTLKTAYSFFAGNEDHTNDLKTITTFVIKYLEDFKQFARYQRYEDNSPCYRSDSSDVSDVSDASHSPTRELQFS